MLGHVEKSKKQLNREDFSKVPTLAETVAQALCNKFQQGAHGPCRPVAQCALVSFVRTLRDNCSAGGSVFLTLLKHLFAMSPVHVPKTFQMGSHEFADG